MMHTMSRREFLRLCAAGLALGGTASLAQASVFAFDRIEHDIALRDLPRDFEGYRIGFLTDFHLGPFVPHDWILDAMRIVHEGRIDLLILGGDYQGVPDSAVSKLFGAFRNDRYEHISEDALPWKIFADFSDLLSTVTPPDGIIAVLGNHDRRNSPVACADTLRRHPGLTLLENERCIIRRGPSELEIAGVADYLTTIPRVPLLKRPRQSILISHNPDFISTLSRAGGLDFGLVLCGHTHGGQIRLPVLGGLIYNVNDLRFADGFAEVGGTRVYTSRGIGMVELPFRLHCPPETTIFTLKSG